MAINLQKGQKVNLTKKSGSLGEISINLNWQQPLKKKEKSFFSKIFGDSDAIDLDLACLYEMKDGSKGVVQALGDCFGSLRNFPYIALDSDDRSGSSVNGETMRVNGAKISEFKRILVFTFIYEGAAN